MYQVKAMRYAASPLFLVLSGIYIIRTTGSDKVYVGSSCELGRRYREHRNDLKRGAHRSQPLQRAADKHGLGSFRFEVLLTCLPSQLLQWEQRMMDLFKAAHSDFGYNCAPASGSCYGTKRTPEQLARMSAAQKAAMTDERKARHAAAARGRVKPHSPETIEKIRQGNQGKYVSPETKERMKQAHIGRKDSPETIAKRKASCAAARARRVNLAPPH